jgi:hypothetical protein
MNNDTPEYHYRPTANDTFLHVARQITDRAKQTTGTLTTSDGAFTIAQRWTQRGLWFATATDAAGETCLLTSPDGVGWEVLAPPAPHYLEGGIYRYGRTVILHKDGRWFMFGVSEPMYTESANGKETRVLLDSKEIGELLFVLD